MKPKNLLYIIGAIVGLLIIFLVLQVSPKVGPGGSSPTPSPRVFTSLADTFNTLQSENGLGECHYFDNCYPEFFTDSVKTKVALEYKIIDKENKEYPLYFGLLRGRSVDIPGIGTGYLENKRILNLQDETWYWELGSCETNRRVYIDAVTGIVAGPIHKYVYCGGMY